MITLHSNTIRQFFIAATCVGICSGFIMPNSYGMMRNANSNGNFVNGNNTINNNPNNNGVNIDNNIKALNNFINNLNPSSKLNLINNLIVLNNLSLINAINNNTNNDVSTIDSDDEDSEFSECEDIMKELNDGSLVMNESQKYNAPSPKKAKGNRVRLVGKLYMSELIQAFKDNTIEFLDLDGSRQLKDSDIETILKNGPSITSFSVNKTPIGDAAAYHLIKYGQKLKEISILGTNITPELIHAMIENLKGVKIIHDYQDDTEFDLFIRED